MKREKKKTNNFLVILVIIFLSIFIILPPVFRVVFKTDVSNKNTSANKTNKLVVLNCKYASEKYMITSNTTYNNGEITKVYLVYNDNVYTDDLDTSSESITTVEPADDALDITTAFNLERDNLTKLIDVEYTNEGFTTKIVLTKKTYLSNKSERLITERFQEINEQKKYYEGIGYNCQKLTN